MPPPDRAPVLLLVDIVERADAIAAVLRRLGPGGLGDDDVLRSAVLWSLAVMGEAAARLPAGFRVAHRDVEWVQVAGFRHFVVHAYEHIDPSIVEVTARERVPPFRTRVMEILETEFPLVARALSEHQEGEAR